MGPKIPASLGLVIERKKQPSRAQQEVKAYFASAQ
jgi:hypothetical protein